MVDGGALILAAAMQGPPFPPGVIPDGVVEMAQAFFTMVAVIALGVPLIRMFSRRFERGPQSPAVPQDVTARLERIEQGVEAMAIEIERISEGQRFTTKLLAEQRTLPRSDAPGAAKAPADGER